MITKPNTPIPPQECSTLSGKIRQKISAIKQLEEDLPAMLIIHDLRDWTVAYMSRRGRSYLNVTMEELASMGTEYHTRFFNPEDSVDYVPKILGLLERNNDDEMISNFQQVRQSPQHPWEWFLSCTKIILRDDAHAPLLTLTTAIPVDAQHHIAVKAQRLLDENNFLRRNHHIFKQLTKREREILRMMANGLSSAKIADTLHISETTANTHRRNIKSKLKAKTNFDISQFAHAFDVI